MTDQETTSEARGRRVGEMLGRRVGGVLGRRLGEWLAAGIEAAKPGESAAADTTADGHDADDDRAENEESDEEEPDEEESGEGDGSESGGPTSRADLDAMSYRELQKLAKEVDVTANLSREKMEDRLVETLDLDE